MITALHRDKAGLREELAGRGAIIARDERRASRTETIGPCCPRAHPELSVLGASISCMHSEPLDLRQVTAPGDVTPELRQALIGCWIEVTNAGGAAGFPFPPIDASQAAPAVDSLVKGLVPETSRLVVASINGNLAGWLNVRRDPFEVISHWGTLHHVQTRTGLRGRGIGAALMNHVRDIARDEMGLEQLHLAARGGVGLEDFYGRLGWKEIGCWPGALRLAPGDDRDEILMILAPL